MLDRLEVAAASIWFVLALECNTNVGDGLLGGFVLLFSAIPLVLAWLARSAVLLADGRARGRVARWLVLPGALAMTFIVAKPSVSQPLLIARVKLSERALLAYPLPDRTGHAETSVAVNRPIGLFWVRSVRTDGRCRWFTVSTTWSPTGLLHCREVGYSVAEFRLRIVGDWWSWTDITG